MHSNIILSRSCGIHNGTFHADEVTACALLLIFDLIDRDKIVRTRDEAALDHLEYVCDVGGVYHPEEKRFDHHQSEYQGHLSSAGMVLKYLYDQEIIDELKFHWLREKLVKGVDEIDNGLIQPLSGHYTFSGVIANYVPIRYDAHENEMQAAFEQALEFAIWHIQRFLDKYDYISLCKDKVQIEMTKGDKCLYFDQAMPWMEAFFELGGNDHPAEFIIMPSGNHWKLRGIPPTYDLRMNVRKPLPESWAGLLQGDLKKVTGIPGAIFCHKGRFISVWETKNDALKALALVNKSEGE
ncbi:MAG: MYG1 family protein [Simkaniaceae bacterium]|nr:MYG1 family protein [Simkaniaceae bacterium]